MMNPPLTDATTKRLRLQVDLDGGRSQSARNIKGQFATPSSLAFEVVKEGLRNLPDDEAIRFLDPAFGLGVFYDALLSASPKDRLSSAVAYEIDPYFGEPASELWAKETIEIRIDDFTRATPDRNLFNLVVCNPPYVRHHHLRKVDKNRLRASVNQLFNIGLSGLSGLYCYFLMLSKLWMEEGGIGVWLIPSEFMDVNYGQQVKRFLCEHVELIRIHRADPCTVQFDDALVSSAIVVFRNRAPQTEHEVAFTFGGSIEQPAVSANVAIDVLSRESKWTRYPKQNDLRSIDGITLGELFSIKRGIATGSNKFFIRKQEDWNALGVPGEFLVPILPSPRHLPETEISADSYGNPKINSDDFLFNCDIMMEQLERAFPTVAGFVSGGFKTIANGYLCSRRTPWYSQEKREPAPILCTYMGRRAKTNGKPFRFILNHSRAIAANVYLMMYPRRPRWSNGQPKQEVLRNIWRFLTSLEAGILISEGRVYGGGLHKLEPSELSRVRIPQELLAGVLSDVAEPKKKNKQLTLWGKEEPAGTRKSQA